MHNTFQVTSLVSVPVNMRHRVGRFYPTAFYPDNDQLFENKGSAPGAAPKQGFVQCRCRASLCSDLKREKKEGMGERGCKAKKKRKQLAVLQ